MYDAFQFPVATLFTTLGISTALWYLVSRHHYTFRKWYMTRFTVHDPGRSKIDVGQLVAQLSDEDLRQAFLSRFQIKSGQVISCRSQAVQHLSGLLLSTERERFGVVYLDGQNAFIGSEILFEGTLTNTSVYPREIIIHALARKAAAIIVGHNHPSGSLSPSSRDREVTRVINQACEAVGIRLHDHLIVTSNGWFSFKENRICD